MTDPPNRPNIHALGLRRALFGRGIAQISGGSLGVWDIGEVVVVPSVLFIWFNLAQLSRARACVCGFSR